jgi:hypothetical protein
VIRQDIGGFVVVSNAYWIFASGIELTSTVFFALSFFRIPLKEHFAKIIIYSFAMASLHFYLVYVLELRHLLILQNIILLIVLLNTLISLPIMASIIITVTGVFFGSLLEALIFITLSKSREVPVYDTIFMASGLAVTAILLFVFVALLQYLKIGFMFKDKYFRQKRHLKVYNYLLSYLFILILMLTLYVSMGQFHLNLNIALFILGGGSIILIGYTYYQNKKAFEDQYDQFTN